MPVLHLGDIIILCHLMLHINILDSRCVKCTENVLTAKFRLLGFIMYMAQDRL